jgi:predicted Rossmann fold nucleotide-binding protein DprA/Smf involved in DNA uptake
LLGQPAGDLVDSLAATRLEPERVAALLDRAMALGLALEELEQSGVQVLSAVDEAYPQRLVERLGPKAPPALHAVGAVSLLQESHLGIVGSRHVSAAAMAVAEAAAEAAVQHGWGVVSGGAKGVDRSAMNAAVEAGGSAVGLLADSLVRVTRDPEIRRLIGDERICLATPYAPTMGFTTGNAMGRNKLIYGLAQRTLVVASDVEQGGTWAGAKEALGKSLQLEVDVWIGDGAGPGNQALVERGARPITDASQLWDAPAPTSARITTEETQLHLGV